VEAFRNLADWIERGGFPVAVSHKRELENGCRVFLIPA